MLLQQPKTFPLAALALTCFLAALPAPASPTPVTPVPDGAAQIRPHKIALKYAMPAHVLKWLERRRSLPPHGGLQTRALLPPGVDRIYAIEGDNSLLVFSTAAGLAAVKALVTSLDVAPPPVMLKVDFFTANAADVDKMGSPFHLVSQEYDPYFDGSGNRSSKLYAPVLVGDQVVQLFEALQKKHIKMLSVPEVSMVDPQVPGRFTFPRRPTARLDDKGLIADADVNYDGTVTMTLTPLPNVTEDPTDNPHGWTEFSIAQVLHSGETLALLSPVTQVEVDRAKPPRGGPVDVPSSTDLWRQRKRGREFVTFITPTTVDGPDKTPKTLPMPGSPVVP